MLLGFPVEGYGSWSHGIWLEVHKPAFDRAFQAWDDPEAYMQLELEGVLANDLIPSGLPHATTKCAGATAHVKAVDPDKALRVAWASDQGLQRQLTTTWPKHEFIRFAVERGYL